MKTIEERSDIYEEISGCYGCQLGQVEEAFIAGAKSEHEELTRWNSPEETPPHSVEVLLKLRNDKDKDVKYEVGYYFHGWHWYGAMIYDDDSVILGWREIHE